MNTKDLMKARFNELQAERDAVLKASAPIAEKIAMKTAEMDKLRAEVKALAKQKKEIEAPVAKLSQEITQLSIALGGKRLSSGA